MKTIEEIREIIKSKKQYLKEKYEVKELGIFGSYVRDEQTGLSDIDILVEFEKSPGFVKFIKLENYLNELLDIRVDLVTRKALKPHMANKILQELQNV